MRVTCYYIMTDVPGWYISSLALSTTAFYRMLPSRFTRVCGPVSPPSRVQGSRRHVKAMVLKESYDMPMGTVAPDFKVCVLLV